MFLIFICNFLFILITLKAYSCTKLAATYKCAWRLSIINAVINITHTPCSAIFDLKLLIFFLIIFFWFCKEGANKTRSYPF